MDEQYSDEPCTECYGRGLTYNLLDELEMCQTCYGLGSVKVKR